MGNNIRKLRKERKISQSELCEAVRIHQASLSRMENGNHSISDDQLIALADFFNVSVDYILGRDSLTLNKTIFQTKEFDVKDILHKLQTFNKKEVLQLRGAIDYILETKFGDPISDESTDSIFHTDLSK